MIPTRQSDRGLEQIDFFFVAWKAEVSEPLGRHCFLVYQRQFIGNNLLFAVSFALLEIK